MEILKNELSMFEFLIITTITIVAILIFKYYYDRRWIFKCGSKLPGPKPWPIIGNAWHFLGAETDIISKLQKFRGYKLFAVWLGHELNVFVRSPEYAEIYCKSSNLLHRSEKVKFAKPIAPKGLLFAGGTEWTKTKKLMESALTYSIFKNSIPVVQEQSEILTQRLKCEIGKLSFPILYYLQDCIFDIIAEITAEFELKAQKSELTLLKEINIVGQLIRMRFYNISHQWDFLYKFLPEGKKYYSTLDSLLKFVDDALIDVMKKYEEEKKELGGEENVQKLRKKIFLRTLFDDETLSLSDIRDHIITMIITAFETTSNVLSCVLVMLALHPDVQENTYEEISSVIDGSYSDEKIQQLEYLDMVIKETLRLFPAVPINFRQATGDVQMGEYLIPAGAEVGLHIYELHRDPEQFDNPHKFNPDNFLPENVAKRHPYSYIPFSSGMRNCIGSKFAVMIMKVITATLLLNYKFECDYETMEDIKFRGDICIELKDGGRVRILER